MRQEARRLNGHGEDHRRSLVDSNLFWLARALISAAEQTAAALSKKHNINETLHVSDLGPN